MDRISKGNAYGGRYYLPCPFDTTCEGVLLFEEGKQQTREMPESEAALTCSDCGLYVNADKVSVFIQQLQTT